MKHQAIHWPDHNIGKRESRRIRDAHNALYNDFHVLLDVVNKFIACADKAIQQGGEYRDDGSCMREARAAAKKVTT